MAIQEERIRRQLEGIGEEMAERELEDGEEWVEKKSTLGMLMILMSSIKLHAFLLNTLNIPPSHLPMHLHLKLFFLKNKMT
jgi:hypothetical protein